MEIIRQNVGRAIVRVGLTQFPAGLGAKDVLELKSNLVDPRENLGMGTQMFAKILRIVSKWYGNPGSEEVFQRIFDDAIYAWKSGEFEGQSVFQANYPDGQNIEPAVGNLQSDEAEALNQPDHLETRAGQSDLQNAGIRIDLSHIGAQK